MAPKTEVNFEEHMSVEAHKRVPPTLRKLVAEFDGAKDIVSMHAGIPPHTAFPFACFKATLVDGTEIEISEPRKMYSAQQYATESCGYGPLMKWIAEHMKKMHNPVYPHEHLLTNGSNHLIEMTLNMLMETGDPVLAEEYTYSNILESTLMPKGYQCIPLPMDSDGIIPEDMRKVLIKRKEEGLKIPRVLYTIPVAQNPTGAITTEARKHAVYLICQEFDIIILEDDPYYYLQYGTVEDGPPGADPVKLGKSYLALDTDGRVIRTDSFSKIVAPGFRTGWVTAAKPFRDRLSLYMLSSTMGTCSLSACMMHELLMAWGEAGFDAHLKKLQKDYGDKSRTIIEGFEQHMQGLGEWVAPRGGMFVWMKLHGIASTDSLTSDLLTQKVVIVPGHIFDVSTGGQPKSCSYIRLSCVAPVTELKEGVERLARVIKAAQAKQIVINHAS